MPSAIDVLKQDHDAVRQLLAQLVETTERAPRRRAGLLDAIATEIHVHTTVEEEIFYPAVREAAETEEQRGLTIEATEEHREIDRQVLPDLQNTPFDSLRFTDSAELLEELIDHHIDEEEDELFVLADRLLGAARLEELGARVAARQKQLRRELRAA